MQAFAKLLVAGLLSVAGCNWFVRPPQKGPLEIRNESTATIVACKEYERCEKSENCKSCGGMTGMGTVLLPGNSANTYSTVLNSLGSAAVELSNGDRLYRTDLRPILLGDRCIITLTDKLEISVEYVPAKPGDPPRFGTTLSEPIVPCFDPEQSIVITAYDKANRAAEILDISYTAVGKNGETRSGNLSSLNTLRDGSVWIPLSEFRDIFRHEEFPEREWSLNVEAFALGRKTISIDPTQPASIACQFSERTDNTSHGFLVNVKLGNRHLGYGGGARDKGERIRATLQGDGRLKVTLGNDDGDVRLTIDMAAKVDESRFATDVSSALPGTTRLSFVSEYFEGEELILSEGVMKLTELSSTECTGGFSGSGRDAGGNNFTIKGNFYGLSVTQETKP